MHNVIDIIEGDDIEHDLFSLLSFFRVDLF